MGIKRLLVEVCCSSESLLGQIASKEFKDCHVARITEKCDLNKPDTRKDIVSLVKSCSKHNIPVLVLVSLPCTGGSSWSHVNLTLPGNREKVIEARRKFVKLYASFVDMSDGLDKIGVQYAIEWPKHCVYWDWTRVKKWIEAHPIQKAHFDGCRFGLINKKGNISRSPGPLPRPFLNYMTSSLEDVVREVTHMANAQRSLKAILLLLLGPFIPLLLQVLPKHCTAKQEERPWQLLPLKCPKLYCLPHIFLSQTWPSTTSRC